jgi:UDP-2,3-diacylglucosamine hydrolase
MNASLFPKNYNSKLPVALIAGKGRYPFLTAKKALAAGFPMRLIVFKGESIEQELWDLFSENERIEIDLGQIGKLLKCLERFEAKYALMAGQVTPKRLFKGYIPDLRAIKIMASLKRRNAQTIFGAVIAEIEKNGTTMLDARCWLESELASHGLMTPKRPVKVDLDYIEHGIYIAKEMARLEVGQSVVVRKGTVMAVESFEGTDPMIERAGNFKTDELIFVKTVKVDQDYRFDVPVVGERTIQKLADAGIFTMAVEADHTLMLDKNKLIEQAQRAGISIIGYR